MNGLLQKLITATNWPILASVSLLSIIGMITISAADVGQVNAQRQVLFFVIGIVCMLAFQRFNYLQIGRLSWPFYILSISLVIYTLLPFGFTKSKGLFGAPPINGARAWINLGFLHLEPAELTKIAFCLVLARYLRFRSNYRTLSGLLAPFGLALLPMVLVLKEPALGMAMLFLPTLFAVLFAAGAKWKHLLAIIGMGVMLLVVAWIAGKDVPNVGHVPLLIKPYQWVRVQALLHPDDPMLQKDAYQQERALEAIGRGGLFGKGLGNIEAGRHIPEGHNDMIFALIGEQLGLLGTVLLLTAYIILFAAGIEIAAGTREPFGRLLAVGVVAMFAGQAFLNLMVATRLMPVTGITLPFVSYGGSSLLASFIAAALLLNIGYHRPLVMANDSFEFD